MKLIRRMAEALMSRKDAVVQYIEQGEDDRYGHDYANLHSCLTGSIILEFVLKVLRCPVMYVLYV